MAERISRREFLKTSGVAGGSFALGWILSDTSDDDRQAALMTPQGDPDMADKLGQFELWRATDTEDYKSIQVNSHPALILVESGQYEGIRLHTGGSN